jgi:hypothetical protein
MVTMMNLMVIGMDWKIGEVAKFPRNKSNYETFSLHTFFISLRLNYLKIVAFRDFKGIVIIFRIPVK